MADANNSDSGGSNSNSNSNNNSNPLSDPGTIVSIVALFISIVALLGSIMQVLQQYYASATGYSNCDEKVMGEWHKSKRRIFRMAELRFEVQFEAPVIFVCPPDNKNGPVRKVPIYYVDGTSDSLEKTRTLLPSQEDRRMNQLSTKDKVHTADNERATWVTMLGELQNMENKSEAWQNKKFEDDAKKGPPRQGQATLPAKFSEHTLAVALQSKTRSWDTMPSNVRKPYATTTMCHMIEMAAMLGVYWMEFDRSEDKYRAEGNGYVLTGSNVTDLGIMFSFQICGKSKFEENRVIPVDEVKELCFGFVSTIFRGERDIKRLDFPNEELSGVGTLQLSSRNEIAETLVLTGCNTNTTNYFRNEKKKVTHVFPLAFELLGMLAKTLQLRNSAFRMLPNPTCFHWNKKAFSMRKLLLAFRQNLDDSDLTTQSAHIRRLSTAVGKVCLELMDKDHAETHFSIRLIDQLHRTLDKCDHYLRNDVNHEKVVMVIREHFQEVLKMINREDAPDPSSDIDGAAANGEGGDGNGHGDGQADGGERKRRVSFEGLNAASPEEKQAQFMEIYFAMVLPRVRRQTVEALLKRRKTTYTSLIAAHGHSLSTGSIYSAQSSRSPSPSPSPGLPTPSPVLPTPSPGAPQVQIQEAPDSDRDPGSRGLKRTDTEFSDDQLAVDIWCTLVLRMLCWLLLHDFHKKDVQISKSELLGSRLPVYIA